MDPPATDQPPRAWSSLGRTLLVAGALGTAFGLIFASQWVLLARAFGHDIRWTSVIVTGMVDSWPWVLLVPGIFAWSRWFPVAGPRWPLHIVLQVIGLVLAATLYSTIHSAATTWIVPDNLQVFRGGRRGPPPPESAPAREPLNISPRSADTQAGTDRRPERPPKPPPSFGDRVKFTLTTRWQLHLLTYTMIAGAWHWMAQQRHFRARERQTRELSRQLAEARLQALRMQLNPHFLFNTLNAVSTLVHRSPAAADEMIACLSDFLRLTLSSPNAPEVSLQKELEFARRYLDIEKVRFGDRMAIREDIDPASLPVLVPTLILQPLIENAVRHGIEPRQQPGEVRIHARRAGDQLLLVVADTGPGLSSAAASPRNGIGLANTRSRLAELHGENASLRLDDSPGGGLQVEIRVPWRLA